MRVTGTLEAVPDATPLTTRVAVEADDWLTVTVQMDPAGQTTDGVATGHCGEPGQTIAEADETDAAAELDAMAAEVEALAEDDGQPLTVTVVTPLDPTEDPTETVVRAAVVLGMVVGRTAPTGQ